MKRNCKSWFRKKKGKGKGIVRAGTGNKKRKEIARAGAKKQWDF